MAAPTIGFSGIAMRFLFAFALVCFTWNPTRYNYVAWALAQWQNLGPLVAFSGLVLLAGWFFFLRTTARSLGVIGLVLCLALSGVGALGSVPVQRRELGQHDAAVVDRARAVQRDSRGGDVVGASAQSMVGSGDRRRRRHPIEVPASPAVRGHVRDAASTSL